jgi:hypothetical protein
VDIHLLTMFCSNSWIPNEEGNDCPFLFQASIEGWFLKEKRDELNKVWSGLAKFSVTKIVTPPFYAGCIVEVRRPITPLYLHRLPQVGADSSDLQCNKLVNNFKFYSICHSHHHQVV